MENAWLKNFLDILLLPFTVTVIIPLLIYSPDQQFPFKHLLISLSGAFFMVVGLCLFAYTLFLFNTIAKGTLAPWSSKEKLVVTGPYAHCRNPMITGVWFIVLGEALVFSSTAILLWSLVFLIVNTIYFLLYEEPELANKFGDTYRKYKQHVPRWLPRIKPYKCDD
jgi:protein-S-isoprenylcysteine O-methyltransferase Ste14